MHVHMAIPEKDLIPILACLGLGTLRRLSGSSGTSKELRGDDVPGFLARRN